MKRRGRARPKEELATWCEARLEGCTGRAEHRHHKLRRSQGGDDQTPSADLCRACHEHIHANPAWSYEAGWLIRSGA